MINDAIKNIINVLGKVDYDISYINNNGDVIGKLYLAAPLSVSDIRELEGLSLKMNFNYNVITDSKRLKNKGRNTLIEIFFGD